MEGSGGSAAAEVSRFCASTLVVYLGRCGQPKERTSLIWSNKSRSDLKCAWWLQEVQRLGLSIQVRLDPNRSEPRPRK